MDENKNISELKQEQNILGKIASTLIDKYRVIYLMLFVLLIVGVKAYNDLPRETMPDINFPYGVVGTVYPGASPAEVENLVTDVIEKKLNDIEDLENITSTSADSYSTVILEFNTKVDIDDKIEDIKSELTGIESELPEEAESPSIFSFKTGEIPVLTLGVAGDYEDYELKEIAEDIKEELEKVKDVKEVKIVGGVEREIQVIVNPAKLDVYGISKNDIKNAINYSNINIPGGAIELDGLNYNLRTIGEISKVSEIENIIVKVSGKTPIFLKDIAEVKDTHTEEKSYATLGINNNGEYENKKLISLSVLKSEDGDATKVSKKVKKTLEAEKGKTYPSDIEIDISTDYGKEIENQLSDVTGNALSGLFMVITVLFLFIGLSESMIVAFVIPLSLLGTFIALGQADMSLNSISLLALILALGMLVDNAIVVMENIDRLREKGLSPLKAAKVATNQVAPAIMASTMTTLAAFFPLAIMDGIMGEFIKSIPLTVIFALTASFFISLTVTPALCSRFLKGKKMQGKGKQAAVAVITITSYLAFANGLTPTLLSVLAAIIFGSAMYFKEFRLENTNLEESKMIKDYSNNIYSIITDSKKRKRVIMAAIAAFIMSIALIPLGVLKVELVPKTDSEQIYVNIDLPKGYLVEDTEVVVKEVESRLYKYEEIEKILTTVGTKGSDGRLRTSNGATENEARITIDLVDDKDRDKKSYEMIDLIREDVKDIAGAKIELEEPASGPSSGKPISIELKGGDLETLEEVSDELKVLLDDIDGVVDSETTFTDGVPELRFTVNKSKAKLLGLEVASIGSGIRTTIIGTDVGIYKENQEEYDIVIKDNDKNIKSIADLEKITFTNNKGEKIGFSQVVKIEEAKGVVAIEHDELDRVAKVSANVEKGKNLAIIMNKFNEKVKEYRFPNGVEMSIGGESERMADSFGDMFFNMQIAVLLVFVILTVQFNSFSQPFVILMSVPLAVIGVLPGLVLTGNNFGFYAFFGIVALVGIAVNDAIVLIDYINYLRSVGIEKYEAVREAGKTRFIPVIATSLTTIGGMLPLALKDPEYAQMGFALIFGLMASTVLTLLMIPVIYTSVDEFKEKFKKKVPVLIDEEERIYE
ncbi:MAG: efflux RND transporter permease subunit [Clostridia bacterium]|jgi:HAE1 family hydrophobic/amphiphilic exporter-1|nr:efflux RND transporter permease subunit [Clostridia bacterium]